MSPMRGRAHLVAAVALVAAVGCQAPGVASQPTPTQAASVPVDKQVAAADKRFWAGDYDGAETAYQALVKSGTAGAASHYAIFLAYQSRFSEAVAQARAGVEQKADSAALARLTRALDWSDDIDQAVAAGGRAVSTQPVDPIATAYYAEALADAGRFADARRELGLAEKANSPDEYVRAEIFREWANYYRDAGDIQAELNNTQLALKAQPKFPERTLELARYYYVQQKPDLAHAALDAAAKLSTSYGFQVAAGDSAFYAGALDVAGAHFQAALAVTPAGATASLGSAVVKVVGARDFTSAHDMLLAAL